MHFTVTAVQIRYQFAELFPADAQHLHQQARRIQAVLAGDMSPDCQAAGGFAADQGIVGFHPGRDVFESHGYLDTLFAMCLRDPVQQVGGCDIAHRRSFPAFLLQQV